MQRWFLHLALFFVWVGLARGLTIAGKEAKPHLVVVDGAMMAKGHAVNICGW